MLRRKNAAVLAVFVAALTVLGGIAGAAGPEVAEEPVETVEVTGSATLAALQDAPLPPVREPLRPALSDRIAEEPAAATWTGVASWYGAQFAGQRTASGDTFDPSELTAAHRTLAFGTVVRVTHLDTGRSVEVEITDRGPYVKGREIDLSRAAAETIGLVGKGHAKVMLEVLAAR